MAFATHIQNTGACHFVEVSGPNDHARLASVVNIGPCRDIWDIDEAAFVQCIHSCPYIHRLPHRSEIGADGRRYWRGRRRWRRWGALALAAYYSVHFARAAIPLLKPANPIDKPEVVAVYDHKT